MTISKQSFVISGLNVDAYSNAELADPSLPVIVFFFLHGRFGSAKDLEPAIDAVFKSTYEDRPSESRRQDLVIVTFDQRNHGSRLVENKSNFAWNTKNPEKHNERHAFDMYSIQAGTAKDAIFLIDFLPAYLYPSGERTIQEWGVGGVSLGGHATWLALAHEPRLSYGVPIIGCPDYLALISQRAERSFISFSSPYVPDTFRAFLKQHDPASTAFDTADGSNPFLGKKILVLSGADDTLVPWSASSSFIERLEVGEHGSKVVALEEGAGHEFTHAMVGEMSKFVWEKCLTRVAS